MLKYEKVEFDYDLPIKLKKITFQGPYAIPDNHWHRSIEILRPTLGGLSVWINGKEILVEPGQLVIINTRDIHRVLLSDPIGYYEGYVLQLNYEYLTSIEAKLDSYVFLQVDHNELTKVMIGIIDSLVSSYNIRSKYQKVLIEGNLLKLMYYLFNELSIPRSRSAIIKSDKYQERLVSIINYLDHNYQDELSIEMIAAKFGLSSGYLSKLFKENFDLTIKEYLMSVRMKNAYQQLIYSDLPIIDIALNNGFPNISSFYTLFKKEYQMTPSVYRKKMRK